MLLNSEFHTPPWPEARMHVQCTSQQTSNAFMYMGKMAKQPFSSPVTNRDPSFERREHLMVVLGGLVCQYTKGCPSTWSCEEHAKWINKSRGVRN